MHLSIIIHTVFAFQILLYLIIVAVSAMRVILYGCILAIPSKLQAPYFDLHFENDIECRLRTNLYDKRDDFNFPFVNFPWLS